MPTVENAVITAAGLGSRLGLDMPKCLVKVAGRSIIDYQLDLLKDVENVRIVVGFHKDLVIRHVKDIRPDAVFVCNHRYAQTTTLQSLNLGARGFRTPFLSLDGDVIPERESFLAFMANCVGEEMVTAICDAVSTDPVYATTSLTSTGLFIDAFRRSPPTPAEWPGITYFQPGMLTDESTFVFELVTKFLPVRAIPVRCWEVDTPEDLRRVTREFGDAVGK